MANGLPVSDRGEEDWQFGHCHSETIQTGRERPGEREVPQSYSWVSNNFYILIICVKLVHLFTLYFDFRYKWYIPICYRTATESNSVKFDWLTPTVQSTINVCSHVRARDECATRATRI